MGLPGVNSVEDFEN